MALDTLAQRSLQELLDEHADGIAALKERLGETEPPEDDQLLLRYLLQESGDVDAALAKATEGRALRQTYADLLGKAKKGEPLPQEAKIHENLCHGLWTYPDAASEREYPPILITRSGGKWSNAQELMKELTVDEMAEYVLWERVRAFDCIVSRSREAGKLVLMVSVNDMDGASMITGREPKFFEALKKASDAGGSLCPLLYRKHIMVNSGTAVSILFKIVSVFIPKRVLAKIAFMRCSELVDASGIPPDKFPDFLGGTCKVPPGSPLSRT